MPASFLATNTLQFTNFEKVDLTLEVIPATGGILIPTATAPIPINPSYIQMGAQGKVHYESTSNGTTVSIEFYTRSNDNYIPGYSLLERHDGTPYGADDQLFVHIKPKAGETELDYTVKTPPPIPDVVTTASILKLLNLSSLMFSLVENGSVIPIPRPAYIWMGAGATISHIPQEIKITFTVPSVDNEIPGYTFPTTGTVVLTITPTTDKDPIVYSIDVKPPRVPETITAALAGTLDYIRIHSFIGAAFQRRVNNIITDIPAPAEVRIGKGATITTTPSPGYPTSMTILFDLTSPHNMLPGYTFPSTGTVELILSPSTALQPFTYSIDSKPPRDPEGVTVLNRGYIELRNITNASFSLLVNNNPTTIQANPAVGIGVGATITTSPSTAATTFIRIQFDLTSAENMISGYTFPPTGTVELTITAATAGTNLQYEVHVAPHRIPETEMVTVQGNPMEISQVVSADFTLFYNGVAQPLAKPSAIMVGAGGTIETSPSRTAATYIEVTFNMASADNLVPGFTFPQTGTVVARYAASTAVPLSYTIRPKDPREPEDVRYITEASSIEMWTGIVGKITVTNSGSGNIPVGQTGTHIKAGPGSEVQVVAATTGPTKVQIKLGKTAYDEISGVTIPQTGDTTVTIEPNTGSGRIEYILESRTTISSLPTVQTLNKNLIYSNIPSGTSITVTANGTTTPLTSNTQYISVGAGAVVKTSDGSMTIDFDLTSADNIVPGFTFPQTGTVSVTVSPTVGIEVSNIYYQHSPANLRLMKYAEITSIVGTCSLVENPNTGVENPIPTPSFVLCDINTLITTTALYDVPMIVEVTFDGVHNYNYIEGVGAITNGTILRIRSTAGASNISYALRGHSPEPVTYNVVGESILTLTNGEYSYYDGNSLNPISANPRFIILGRGSNIITTPSSIAETIVEVVFGDIANCYIDGIGQIAPGSYIQINEYNTTIGYNIDPLSSVTLDTPIVYKDFGAGSNFYILNNNVIIDLDPDAMTMIRADTGSVVGIGRKFMQIKFAPSANFVNVLPGFSFSGTDSTWLLVTAQTNMAFTVGYLQEPVSPQQVAPRYRLDQPIMFTNFVSSSTKLYIEEPYRNMYLNNLVDITRVVAGEGSYVTTSTEKIVIEFNLQSSHNNIPGYTFPTDGYARLTITPSLGVSSRPAAAVLSFNIVGKWMCTWSTFDVKSYVTRAATGIIEEVTGINPSVMFDQNYIRNRVTDGCIIGACPGIAGGSISPNSPNWSDGWSGTLYLNYRCYFKGAKAVYIPPGGYIYGTLRDLYTDNGIQFYPDDILTLRFPQSCTIYVYEDGTWETIEIYLIAEANVYHMTNAYSSPPCSVQVIRGTQFL
jgi:hypothetical protein